MDGGGRGVTVEAFRAFGEGLLDTLKLYDSVNIMLIVRYTIVSRCASSLLNMATHRIGCEQLRLHFFNPNLYIPK